MGDINYDHEMVCEIVKTTDGFKVVCKCGCHIEELVHTDKCEIIIFDCTIWGFIPKKKKRIICRCNKEQPQGPRN